jgi:uncharacterized membrane protein YkoI
MKPTLIILIAPFLVNFALHPTAVEASIESPRSGNVTRAARTVSVPKRAVGRTAASNIALRAIERQFGQTARVTGITREDDHGARWEVEITSTSGREFDVYINAAGRVVKVVRKGSDFSPSGLNRQNAAAIALARVREISGSGARVTGISREDDYGAAWEVEVTRNDGFEYDVYVDAAGAIVRIKEIGFGG